MRAWFVNVGLRAEAVFERYGSWWEPGPFTWLYVPRPQAFWQQVAGIDDQDDGYDGDVWRVMANLPEVLAARTAATRAEAEANVWRLLVQWAQEPGPVPAGEVEVVWDDSDDPAPPVDGWWFE